MCRKIAVKKPIIIKQQNKINLKENYSDEIENKIYKHCKRFDVTELMQTSHH